MKFNKCFIKLKSQNNLNETEENIQVKKLSFYRKLPQKKLVQILIILSIWISDGKGIYSLKQIICHIFDTNKFLFSF